MAKEKIISLLGMPRSGKSSYIRLALSYMDKKGKYKLFAGGGDYHSTKSSAAAMKKGHWPDKTEDKSDLGFSFTKGFWSTEYTVSINDYAGELFQLMVDDDSFSETMSSLNEKLEQDRSAEDMSDDELFALQCLASDGFMFFVDSEFLLDPLNEEHEHILSNFIRGILSPRVESTESNPKIAFIVTKVDLLEGLREFCQGGDILDNEKIKAKVKDYAGAFFHYLDAKMIDYQIFGVTALRNKESRAAVDPEKGACANGRWSIDDMAQEMAPFDWMLDKI